MTGTIGKTLAANPAAPNIVASTGTSSSATRPRASSSDKVVVLPAFFVGDLLSKFSGAIGEVAGGAFGNAALGKQVGNAASPLLKLLPFSIVPPSVTPASAGPDGGGAGSGDTLVVVPAGFIGGLLGGIGGNLLGGAIGDWFGDKNTGANVGKAAGGILGGLLPFQVVPPQFAPQSVGPGGEATQEPMVVVPAGFFGNLIKGVASTVATIAGGDSTVSTIANAAAGLSDLLPFQDVPPNLAPQAAGPDGQATDSERLIVVPAGFFGNLLSGLADTVGGAIGGAFGDARTGAAIGNAAKPLLGLIPFHTVPPELAPQSAGPDGGGQQQELMVVPAGLFSGLLSTYAGAIGQFGGGLLGNAQLGKQIGDAAAPLLKLLPFSVQDAAPVRA
jgi:hypothetical protein